MCIHRRRFLVFFLDCGKNEMAHLNSFFLYLCFRCVFVCVCVGHSSAIEKRFVSHWEQRKKSWKKCTLHIVYSAHKHTFNSYSTSPFKPYYRLKGVESSAKYMRTQCTQSCIYNMKKELHVMIMMSSLSSLHSKRRTASLSNRRSDGRSPRYSCKTSWFTDPFSEKSYVAIFVPVVWNGFSTNCDVHRHDVHIYIHISIRF